ncbi:cytochrome P450 [Xylariaceae sp. FL1651]|nr:cytochrome P450 [Xylariaceae sp. FL1651]
MGILDLGQGFTVFCFLVAGYFFASTFYQWQRLRHIPGPFIASISYIWIGYSGYSGKQYEIHKGLGEKYGPLVRIGPNEISTDDPEVIRSISSAKSTYPRSGWYDGARFHPDSDAMFTIVDPVRHDKLKAKVSHGYSGRETPGLESAVEEQIANLISLLRRKYVHKPRTGSPVVPLDLSRVIPLFTLDVISRIALGKEFGCLQTDTDIVGFYHVMEAFSPVLNVLADVPWARKIVYSPLCIKLFGPKPTDTSGLGSMMKMTNDEVHKRYVGEVNDTKDILASFRRHGVTEAECQTEALFMFVAGSETSSSAIRIALLYLTATPMVYQKLKADIKAAIISGRASSPITAAEARDLPYLQAVIYESMRIRPVATATFSREVPPEGDTIHGQFIPGGTAIGPNLSAVMRSKALFGEDADVFRPERFLEVDEETRTEMQRNVELNFGYGRWMCAGKPIAWLELYKTLFELLREFDFQIIDPKKGIRSFSHGAWIDKDMLVRVTESDMFA